MVSFWVLAALLTCFATALVVWPLLKRRPAGPGDASDEQARRLAVYRDRRREIQSECDAGRLSPEEAARAIDELVAEAAAQFPGAESLRADAAPARRPSPVMPWAVAAAILVPALALGIYTRIGAPGIAGMAAAALRGELSPQRLSQMVDELTARAKAKPDDGEAWAMLAEARRLKNDAAGAAEAYDKAVALLPPDARLLADYAETLVIVSGGDFSGKPLALLERALRADPDDGKALALMGAAQYRLGHPEEALKHLRKLVAQLPADSGDPGELKKAIARIESELAARNGGAPAAAPAAGAAAAPATGAAAITGQIALDDALRAKVPAGAVLFIVAREPDARAPLAVRRVTVDRWPVSFDLGDAQAMDPSRPLSKAGRVVVEARVSLRGDAMRQSGDPIGTTGPVVPGTHDVTIRIDRLVP